MFLSTRARYGLRAIFALALSYGTGPMSLSQIAKDEGISLNYLEQLFLQLRRDDIITSTRGARGGYSLAREPKDITVGEVLRSLEGPFLAANCVNIEGDNACIMHNSCATRVVWTKMTDALNNVIDSITLEDMLDEQDRLGDSACCHGHCADK